MATIEIRSYRRPAAPRARLAGVLAAAAIATAPLASVVAQTTELKIADTMPAGHAVHSRLTEVFVKDVERLTQGRVTLRHYPGGQLGKGPDSLRLVQTGLQDIGMISPALVSDKMPLGSVAELPGLWTSACQAGKGLWALTRPALGLKRRALAPNGVQPIFMFALPGYQLMISSNRPFNALKDAEGLKIRAAGGALERIVRSLKASPVRLAAPEMYEAMSRGTIDGALFAFSAATSYNLDKLVKVTTEGQNLGTIVAIYGMSDKKWASLPEATRKAMATAGERATLEGCKGIDQEEEASKSKMRAAGVKFVSLGADDQAALDRTNASVQQDWAEALDKRNLAGSETLKAFKAALR